MQIVKRGEKEQCRPGSPRGREPAYRIDHRTDAVLIGRDDQHAEIRPAELLAVLLRGMRGEVDPHLALDAGLLRIGTSHRHRAAVDLHHEIAPAAIRQFQSEHDVRNDGRIAYHTAVGQFRMQGERVCRREPMRSGGDHLVGGDQRDAAARPHCAQHTDLEIDCCDLVLDKGPAGFAVLTAPFGIAELDPIPFPEKSYPAIGESIDHRRRAEGRIVVELGARPVDVAGVEEAQQPVIGAVE